MKIDFSIIVPVYCNEGSLIQTFEAIIEKVIENNKSYTWEIIFVDDGSFDNSYNELIQIYKRDPEHVKIIKLTRNFGQVSAMLAGYKYANGKCVVNISADLQDPPELINEMLNQFFNQKKHIIIAARRDRDEGLFRKKTSQMFYKLIQKLNFPDIPLGGFDYALLSRDVVNIIAKSHEANPFWQGQVLWTGFEKAILPYDRLKREVGISRWSFSKKLKYLIDGILGYSYWPLRAMSVMGILFFILGVIYAFVIFIAYFVGNNPFNGWTPIMILILVLSGIQMLMLGILGEYLWRTLDQVRRRPEYIIEKIMINN